MGANWRTSVNGLIETACLIIVGVCVLPAETWQQPKVWIPAVGLIVAKTVKDFVTKDKNVTGGTVQQTVTGGVAKEGTQSLVDQTVIASIKSGDKVTQEQRLAVADVKPMT